MKELRVLGFVTNQRGAKVIEVLDLKLSVVR